MKNFILGSIGIAIMILSFAIPSGGIEIIPQFSNTVFFCIVFAFVVTIFLLQRKMHKEDRELVRRCNKKVPTFFYYPKD